MTLVSVLIVRALFDALESYGIPRSDLALVDGFALLVHAAQPCERDLEAFHARFAAGSVRRWTSTSPSVGDERAIRAALLSTHCGRHGCKEIDHRSLQRLGESNA